MSLMSNAAGFKASHQILRLFVLRYLVFVFNKRNTTFLLCQYTQNLGVRKGRGYFNDYDP